MYGAVELPSRTITFRSVLNVMVVRWHTHTDIEVVKADYEQMLVAAEDRGVSHLVAGCAAARQDPH